MESLVIFGLLLAILAAAAPFLYALRKRWQLPKEQLEFWQVLQRRGVGAADAARDPIALGAALRRCTLCPGDDACKEWLAANGGRDPWEYCPNAQFLKELEPRSNA